MLLLPKCKEIHFMDNKTPAVKWFMYRKVIYQKR